VAIRGAMGERVFAGLWELAGNRLGTARSASMREFSSHWTGFLCSKRSLDRYTPSMPSSPRVKQADSRDKLHIAAVN
jgi:hypothetical protein